jgi:hypothetical protein
MKIISLQQVNGVRQQMKGFIDHLRKSRCDLSQEIKAMKDKVDIEARKCWL